MPRSPQDRSPHTNGVLAHGRIVTRRRRRLSAFTPAHLHEYSCEEYLLESTRHDVAVVDS